jgi:hypothetical protein
MIEQRHGRRSDWLIAALMGVGFVLAMLIVHWPFAGFMLSPAARNFVFAADQWPYMYPLSEWRYLYWNLNVQDDGTWDAIAFLKILGFAAVVGMVSARVGLAWGNFTRRVRR